MLESGRMTNPAKGTRFLLVLFCSFLLITVAGRAQLIIGQYEDEAPLRTWNALGLTSSASLGMGDVQFAYASDALAALANPSQLVRLPKFTVVGSASYNTASLFKYSLVNTGVLATNKNLRAGYYALDGGGLSVRFKKWALSFAAGTSETYDRPRALYEYVFQGNLTYSLDLSQKGFLRLFNVSVGRSLAEHLSVGLGANLVQGELERSVVEKWVSSDITITDRKRQAFRGFFLSGGVTLELAGRFSAAAVFRSPYIKKSKSTSSLRYQAPAGNTDIAISAASEDEYRLPWMWGIGFQYRFSERLKGALDVSIFDWSLYRVRYFGEEQERRFGAAFKAGAGLEYVESFRLFNRPIKSPIRIGITFDRQPMKEPASSYVYFTAGTGLYMGGFRFNFAGAIGRESGSGNSLKVGRFSSTITYQWE